MSILQKAVEISATLDPALGLELEQEFGADWQGELKAAIAVASEGKDEFDSKAGEPMKSDVANMKQGDFIRKHNIKDVRSLAEVLGLPTKDGRKNIKEAALVSSIYKALDQ